MRKGNPDLHLDLSSRTPLHTALDASEIALWFMNPVTGELHFSPYFYQLVPELAHPLDELESLLALMPASDSYIFRKAFVDPGELEKAPMHACEVRLVGLVSAPRLRFI